MKATATPADVLNVIFWKMPARLGSTTVDEDAGFYVAELADKDIHVEFRDDIFVDVKPPSPPAS